ncbi:hypothetical protein [Allofournierella sp.]|uniref:hypothetical protein n=1 Tax=Allofournierella sp. TaxID=1940256 RepID=UPI003AF67128
MRKEKYMNSLSMATNSGLHDYELVDISINYNQANIFLRMKTPQGKQFLLTVENFVDFKITHTEKWGKGKYICSSDIKQSQTSRKSKLEIKLNSGDEIEICFLTKNIEENESA